MKYTLAALLAASAVVNSQDCPYEGGNAYCGNSPVQQLKFNGLDIKNGQYQEVVSMEGGQCKFNPKSYGGPMAPFNEDMALFFRGPLNLTSLSVFLPGKGNKRSTTQHRSHTKRAVHNHHNHQHLHNKKHAAAAAHEEEKRADMVTAVIDGVAVSWENTWDGIGGTATDAPAPTTDTEPAPATSTTTAATEPSKTSTPDNDNNNNNNSSSNNPGTQVSLGSYGRVAHYDASTQTASGLVFLANLGADGISGTWDTVFGNSLSYVTPSPDKKTLECSPSPEILPSNFMIPDGAEIAIYSDQACSSSSSSCGYSRPGSVAYEGFKSGNKIFMMEFSMPYVSSSSGSTTTATTNMPAIWALNGKIARTGQYSDCSCWKSGCGEADLFEVLTPGLDKAKATFHFHEPFGLGASQWFSRPGEQTIKFAAFFHEESGSISLKVLPDTFDLTAAELTEAQVDSLMNQEGDVGDKDVSGSSSSVSMSFDSVVNDIASLFGS